MQTDLKYIKGDATSPQGSGNKIIVHICNDIGGWGKGFVMALSKRWKAPEQAYRNWYDSQENFVLGEVQFVQVEPDKWVANMIAQRGIRKSSNNIPPIRYEAVNAGLDKVAEFASQKEASVHMPRIGCGLAGGTWDKVEPIIKAAFLDAGTSVTVYDFD